jgi:hypothetical protein
MRNLTATLCLTIAVLFGSSGDSLALPECPGTYNKTTWTNCVGETILPEGTTPVNTGDHYQGIWINGKPEVFGVLTGKKNGKFKYVGEFKSGASHGQGTFTGNSYKYVGQWKDDKRHGQGTLTYANGNKYVGAFRDDKKHGQGTFTFANEKKYVGEFRNNKFHGQGTHTFGKTGNKYVGEFRDGKRHGQGTFTFAKGRKYVGEYRNGKRSGQGTYTFPDGTTYIGEFRDDKLSGQGTYTYANGNKYVGEWKDGNFHGQGTYTYANGKIQKGMFENGSFVGKGFAHAKTIDSIDISKFKPGKKYKNYPESSCKSRNKTVCINKIDYKYLCKNAKSISRNVRNTSSVLYRGDMARFIKSNGSISGIRIKFQEPKYCSVSFSISGIVNGSSRRKTITGRGTTFIVTKKGEILIHYVSTM